MKEDPQISKKQSKKNIIAALDVVPGRFLLLALIVIACDQPKELIDQPLYDGPISSLDSIYTVLSDSGRFVMQIQSPHQNEFENGDTEWPEGVFVEYFDKAGNVTTMFSANYVYYDKAEKLYHAVGNVVVRNHEKGDELTTEELFWNERKEEYYTEKFVTIKSDDEVHTGEGLKANQDFTEYSILKPSGTFILEDDPANPAPKGIPLEK